MTEEAEGREQPRDPETQDWIESLAEVLQREGPQRVEELMAELSTYAHREGVHLPFTANTPYVNTIPCDQQPEFPGDREIERRIKSLVRWNAMAMVVRANREESGIGGHISTFASAATLYEVAQNHFLRARTSSHPNDIVYFQGHASPGNYARAFLEGRLSLTQIDNFRHELHDDPGLASYPHPWLMPDFWNFPTVSMGLGPIQAIYHARFIRYLEDRGLKKETDQRVWAFLGDGETDEPESLGAISLAAREHLDNLIFVINCNLQRLDGPVRGNGKIIQELEANFRGAGWNVIKVIWGDDWDELLEKDETGLLVKRMNEVLDGEMQKFAVEGGDYIREHFFGKYEELKELVADRSDEELEKLRRGGHDPEKVYAAFKAATETEGKPTVVLCQTIKGYGLGAGGEGQNITHNQKKLNEEELLEFRDRFDVPLSDEQVAELPFYRPDEDSEDIQYLKERRRELGGYVPVRYPMQGKLDPPDPEIFDEFLEGTGEREVATTMVYTHLLSKLMEDDAIGKFIVPIVPDEARTFGMDALFRKFGIYSDPGQLYEPVDRENLLYYKEATDGQILEEGITEAGSLSSFIAAGTAYSNHGINTIPFFIFYSMFGFQRVGDLIWAAADARAKGFLIGATSGRTTLAGEGLQHQDGHSHLMAATVPNCMAYDPTFAHEIATIVEEGIRRMYYEGDDVFYYLTVMNEKYVQPAMPEGEHVRKGILKGLYRFRSAPEDHEQKAQLIGSGAILRMALEAQEILSERFDIAADVWSATSWKELHRDAADCERWNTRHPDEPKREPWLTQRLGGTEGPIVCSTDYIKALPDMSARWMPRPPVTLGTDGFGRSDGRESLRDFFEVDAKSIVLAVISRLAREGKVDAGQVQQFIQEEGIDPTKPNPEVL